MYANRCLLLIATAAAVAWATASPAAAKLTSHKEALAAGDPAATAPSFDDDAHGTVFRGEPVGKDAILAHDLACLAVRTGPSRCYESAKELEAAERPYIAAASRRLRPKAHAACAIYDILHIWVSADYTGSVASLADRLRWANIGNGMNDRGSSFVMGDHSGHLAEHYDGLGYWSGWNNRISSRYRN